MFKKNSMLIVAFLMLFSLASCNTYFDLAGYKITAKAEIANYATESNYCTENWSIICGIVDAGRAAVDAAENKTGVDTAVTVAKDAIDEVPKEETPSDMIKNGAYFTTESYGDYVLIKGNLITISTIIPSSEIGAANIISDTFEFTLVDGLYIGSNTRTSLSFKLLNNELVVDISRNGETKKTVFKKDANIELSSENTIKLDVPQNISMNSAGLRWSPTEFMGQTDAVSILLNRAGILGVGVEVKQAGEDDFEIMNLYDFNPEPACFFEVYFPDLNLTLGTNIVRIKHIGGLFLFNDEIRISENSEAVYYSIVVDAQGNFTTKRI